MTTPVKKVPIHLQSSQNRLLIKNGSVVNDDGIQSVDVYIEDGVIKQMGKHLIIPGGTRVIDATDKLVIPGGVDPDVHLQKPFNGVTRSIDDFYQGTRAALIGGTTTVVDCIVPEEKKDGVESLIEAYHRWRGWAEDLACCDYAFKMAISKSHLDGEGKKEMEELTCEKFGINTFKMNMSGSNDCFRESGDLINAFSYFRQIGAVAHVHAESAEIVERETKKLLERGIIGPEGFALAHSETAEEEATMRAATLANQVSCPILVGPVMSSSAAQILAKKKSNGAVVFGETTPAALACEGTEYWHQNWRHAAGFVCAPPIRRGQKDEIVENVATKNLDIIGSAHCTWNSNQRALGSRDFTKIPVGINGVESRMSVLWERAVRPGKIDASQFVALTSAMPAKLLNMWPEKGRLEVGSDADIVIWNPNTIKKISVNNHQLKVDFNVFEGMDVHGVAETVICRGKVVVDEGQIRVMQGYGRYLPVKPFAAFVYDKVKAKEDLDFMPRAVSRSDADMIVSANGSGESAFPPPAPPKVNHAVPAPSQQQSTFDLNNHPDTPDFDTPRQSPSRSSVRVRAPPGGRSSGGFW